MKTDPGEPEQNTPGSILMSSRGLPWRLGRAQRAAPGGHSAQALAGLRAEAEVELVPRPAILHRQMPQNGPGSWENLMVPAENRGKQMEPKVVKRNL